MFQERGVAMIHHLWDEDPGETKTTEEHGVNKSGCDIHALGRERERPRGAQCCPQQSGSIAA